MSDDVFTWTSKSNSYQNIAGTYKQLNDMVKNYATIDNIYYKGSGGSREGAFMKDFSTYYFPKIKEMLIKEGYKINIKKDEYGNIIPSSVNVIDPKANTVTPEVMTKIIQTYTMQIISEDILAQRGKGIKWEDGEEVKNVKMGDVFTNKEIIRIFGYSEKNKRGIHFVDKRAMSGGEADEAFIGKGWDLLNKDFTNKDFAIITVGVRLNPTDVIPKNTKLTGEQQKYFFNKYREMFNPNSASNTGQSWIQTATTR